MSDLDLLRGLGDDVVPPSFDALCETARRRRRLDVAAAGAAVVTAAAVAAGVALLVLPDGDDGALPPSEQPTVVDTTHPLTWALGPTIHYGDQTVTAPAPVAELDVTDAGVVARTEDGAIWFTDGGDLEQVGTLGEPGPAYDGEERPMFTTWGFVVSGNTGSRAAWFEFPEPGVPELVVYDTAARDETARLPLGVEAGSYALLASVTDRYGYWFTSPEGNADNRAFPEARVELATGAQDAVTEREYDADNAAFGTPRTMTIGHEGEDDRIARYVHDAVNWQFAVRGGRVEPQGPQPLHAFDGATQARFEFAAPRGYPDLGVTWLSQWLDDDTVVIAATRAGDDDLLECRFSTGACEVALTVPEQAVMPDIG